MAGQPLARLTVGWVRTREDNPRTVSYSPIQPRSTSKTPLKCVRSKRCRASLGDGCAGDGGNKSSNNTLKVLTPKACARETGKYTARAHITVCKTIIIVSMKSI